jgi:hypothetical protein
MGSTGGTRAAAAVAAGFAALAAILLVPPSTLWTVVRGCGLVALVAVLLLGLAFDLFCGRLIARCITASGALAEPLSHTQIDTQLLRGRVSVRGLRLSSSWVDQCAFDVFLPWFRTKELSIRELRVALSFWPSPRLSITVDGMHLRTYGQRYDHTCMAPALAIRRKWLFDWVDDVDAHDRDRLVAASAPASQRPPATAATAAAARTFCNGCGQLLTPGGGWYHRVGSTYDLSTEAYTQLLADSGPSVAEQFVRVDSPADLGSEIDQLCYCVVGGSEDHAAYHGARAAAQPQPPPAADSAGAAGSSSPALRRLLSHLSLELTDFRFSYSQKSVAGCPVGLHAAYRSQTARLHADNYQLDGFLLRIGGLWFDPLHNHEANSGVLANWKAAWDALRPPGSQCEPPKVFQRYDWDEMEVVHEPVQEWVGSSCRFRQAGRIKDLSVHLLGGDTDSPSGLGATSQEFFDNAAEDCHLRAPLIFANASFEIYLKGFSIDQVERIECPKSSLRVKISTQDGQILARVAARAGLYNANTDGVLQYGVAQHRPRGTGFAVVKQRLTNQERWHWALKCIVFARRAERHEMSWEMLQQRREIRCAYIECWKRHISQDLRLLSEVQPLEKSRLQKELYSTSTQARSLENDIDWDISIFYRRWAWLQIMTEMEFSKNLPVVLHHTRKRMLQLAINALSPSLIDFSWLRPRSFRCCHASMEFCLAEESRADVSTVDNFVRDLQHRGHGTKGLSFSRPRRGNLSLRLTVISEARLPQFRFQAVDGDAVFRQGSLDCVLAGGGRTPTQDDLNGSIMQASCLCSSPLANFQDNFSMALHICEARLKYDPAIGRHLALFGPTCQKLEGLSARVPPLSPTLPTVQLSAARPPSLPGGKTEAAQIRASHRYQPLSVVAVVSRIEIWVPSAGPLQHEIVAAIAGIRLDTGISTDLRSGWCCSEHQGFGQWQDEQLYVRTELMVTGLEISTRSAHKVQPLLLPFELKVTIDDCVLTHTPALPRRKLSINGDRVGFSLSTASVSCISNVLAYINDTGDSREDAIDAAASADPSTKQHQQNVGLDQAYLAPSGDLSMQGVDSMGDQDKEFHPTCFALIELNNCTQYTVRLKDWVCKCGQLLSDIGQTTPPHTQIHWACARRGKLRGNQGAAVFCIDEVDELEFMLCWSIPFCGEDSANVAIGEKGSFTFPSIVDAKKRQYALRHLMHEYTSLHQSHSTTNRVSLGNIQVSSSFGRAPCKFFVLNRKDIQSICRALPRPAKAATKSRRLFLACKLVNRTQYFLQLVKCVFGKHEGECTNAVDIAVPPHAESVWTSGATRSLRGNCGCAIFSVAGKAEIMVQWYVPNVGERAIDSQISHPGAFSKIPVNHIREQVESGPAVKSSCADFNTFGSLRLSHELASEQDAHFAISSADILTEYDQGVLSSGDIPEVEHHQMGPTHPANVALHDGLCDYSSLVVDFCLTSCTAAAIDTDTTCSRKVEVQVDDVCLTMHTGELSTHLMSRVGRFQCIDTFYDGDDMVMAASELQSNGDVADLIKVTLHRDEHPTFTNVKVETSSISMTYNYSTMHFVMGLTQNVSSADQTLPQPEPSTEGNPVDISTDMNSVFRFCLLTKPITLTLSNSKLVPLVRLMLNGIDTSYTQRGKKGHGAMQLDLGLFYHNLVRFL